MRGRENKKQKKEAVSSQYPRQSKPDLNKGQEITLRASFFFNTAPPCPTSRPLYRSACPTRLLRYRWIQTARVLSLSHTSVVRAGPEHLHVSRPGLEKRAARIRVLDVAQHPRDKAGQRGRGLHSKYVPADGRVDVQIGGSFRQEALRITGAKFGRVSIGRSVVAERGREIEKVATLRVRAISKLDL